MEVKVSHIVSFLKVQEGSLTFIIVHFDSFLMKILFSEFRFFLTDEIKFRNIVKNRDLIFKNILPQEVSTLHVNARCL